MQDYLGINAASETGPRPCNEDSYWFNAEDRWMAVIDGIGGPGKGDVAASLVYEGLEAALHQEGTPGERIEAALKGANQQMLSRSLTNPQLKGMGAAVTVAMLDGATLHIWHVGDTRVYAVRQGKWHRLTDDHNLAAFLVKQKQITAEQANTHPGRHTLLRSLGKDANLKLDMIEYRVQTGDRFVFVTDGTYATCPDDVWQAQLSAPIQKCDAQVLVDAAIQAGGQDNATALVVDLLRQIGEGRNRPNQFFPSIERLEVFLEFSQEAIASNMIDSLRQLVLQYTLRLSNTERALLLTQGPDGAIVSVAQRGVSEFVDTRSFAETYVRTVMATGKSFWSEDVTSDPSLDLTRSVSNLSLRSIICIPIETVAPFRTVLYADRAGTAAAFTRQDFDLLTALVLYARLFQENITLQASQRQQIAHMAFKQQLHEAVSNQLDPAAIHHKVLSICMEVSKAERGYILVGPQLQCMASLDDKGKAPPAEAFSPEVIEQVRTTGKPVLQVVAPASAASHLALDLRTVLCAPLLVRQRFLGVIYLTANSLNVSFAEDDLALVNELAMQAALHLEAAVLHEEMRRSNTQLETVISQVSGAAAGGAEAGGSATSGTLSELGGLHFLLRRMMTEGRSGMVQVRLKHGSGAISLVDGVIVQAASSGWDLYGEDALAELFSHRDGEWFVGDRPGTQRDMAKKDFLFINELRVAQRWLVLNGRVRPDSHPVRLSANAAGLAESEAHILSLVTKDRTAADVAKASHMPVIDAMGHLMALELASLVTWPTV